MRKRKTTQDKHNTNNKQKRKHQKTQATYFYTQNFNNMIHENSSYFV